MRPFLKPVLLSLLAVGLLAAFLLGALLLWNNRDSTVYAEGYTEQAFAKIKRGMVLRDVYLLLGKPLTVRKDDFPELWFYGKLMTISKGNMYGIENFFRPPRCVYLSGDRVVVRTTGDGLEGIRPGMSDREVLSLLGEPTRRQLAVLNTLHYTEPGGNGLFRSRIVAIDANDRVTDVISYQFHD